MQTIHSFTFEARYYVSEAQEQINSIFANCSGPWVMSAGRWNSHAEAVNAACAWLKAQLETTASQFEIRLVQVEELELLP